VSLLLLIQREAFEKLKKRKKENKKKKKKRDIKNKADIEKVMYSN
jgi:hypothetical protein